MLRPSVLGQPGNPMKSLRKWLKITSRFSAHAMVIGLPSIMVWGIFIPWPPAEDSFSRMSGAAHLFVGMKVSYVRFSERRTRTEARSYIFLPDAFSWPKLITVSRTAAESPKLSQPSVIKFLILLGTYAFAAYGVWQTWCGRGRRLAHAAENGNELSQPPREIAGL